MVVEMVKGLISGIGKGFFYTIGKILAILFILLVIGTLLSKVDPKDINIKELAYSVMV